MAEISEAKLPKNFVCKLDDAARRKVETYLKEHSFVFSDQAYAYWKAAGDKLNVVAYQSGKLTVQGAKTPDFVLYFLEPEVLHEYTFGYEASGAEGKTHPDDTPAVAITPHGGVDESGKGDFFGPLVIAAVYVDAVSGPILQKAGVQDSKLIKSDRKIAELAQVIRNTVQGRFAVVTIGVEAYNRMYEKIGNLNRMLAWGHARSIENLLERVPDCPRVLADQFGAEHLIRNALLEKGRAIVLDQETKAERDVAVAAASILARAGFVAAMDKLSETYHVTFPKGAGPGVKALAMELLAQHGATVFDQVAKKHFRTYFQVMGLPEPEKKSSGFYRHTV